MSLGINGHRNSAAMWTRKGTQLGGFLVSGAWSLTNTPRLGKQKQRLCFPWGEGLFSLFCFLDLESLMCSQAVVYNLGRRLSLKRAGAESCHPLISVTHGLPQWAAGDGSYPVNVSTNSFPCARWPLELLQPEQSQCDGGRVGLPGFECKMMFLCRDRGKHRLCHPFDDV